MNTQKALKVVAPAKARVQKGQQRLDSRLRGNDGKRHFQAVKNPSITNNYSLSLLLYLFD
jgi:hypothetical protein